MRQLLSLTAWNTTSARKRRSLDAHGIASAHREADMLGRSFSWIEGAILVGTVATVGGFLWLAHVSERAKPLIAREWPADARIIELIVASLSLGVAFAGPLVIATQFLIRGRLSALSLGEWLWTIPLTLYVVAVVLTRALTHVSDNATMSVACVCALIQWLASFVSALALVFLFQRREAAGQTMSATARA